MTLVEKYEQSLILGQRWGRVGHQTSNLKFCCCQEEVKKVKSFLISNSKKGEKSNFDRHIL